MRNTIACAAAVLLILGMAPCVHALSVNVDQIIYQADAGVPNLIDFLSVDVDFATGSTDNELVVTVRNTSNGFGFGNLDDFPATVALTSLGFDLRGGVTGITSGIVTGTDTERTPQNWTFYWGYDNKPLASGPFLDLATLEVDAVVSTLSSAVETPFNSSAGNGDIDGPKHGILPLAYVGDKMPYFAGEATITLTLDGDITDLQAYVDWLNSEGDVVASFGSPDAVPEPSSLLLIGTGLVGLVGLRRKFRN